jgi:hypothetical protein
MARGYNDFNDDGNLTAVPADRDYTPTTVDATAPWAAGGSAASARGLAAAAYALSRRPDAVELLAAADDPLRLAGTHLAGAALLRRLERHRE